MLTSVFMVLPRRSLLWVRLREELVMQHSWNWIAARLSPRRIWSKTATSTPRRPAIAAVEPLGDRVMFSVSVNASSEAGGPPVGDSAELAALIKGELPLVNEEQNLLKLAGPGVTPQTI